LAARLAALPGGTAGRRHAHHATLGQAGDQHVASPVRQGIALMVGEAEGRDRPPKTQGVDPVAPGR
jgi:hypothetical protein